MSDKDTNAKVLLYPFDGDHARANGEMDQFRASRTENIACKEAIEKAIDKGFDGMRLEKGIAKDVLQQFGPERVTYVLASTIQQKSWDERFSRSNREWANSVPMFEDKDRRHVYAVTSHSAVLNGFVSQARRELDAIRDQPEKAPEKPSIKERLAAKPVPGEQSAPPKDRGAR